MLNTNANNFQYANEMQLWNVNSRPENAVWMLGIWILIIFKVLARVHLGVTLV